MELRNWERWGSSLGTSARLAQGQESLAAAVAAGELVAMRGQAEAKMGCGNLLQPRNGDGWAMAWVRGETGIEQSSGPGAREAPSFMLQDGFASGAGLGPVVFILLWLRQRAQVSCNLHFSLP